MAVVVAAVAGVTTMLLTLFSTITLVIPLSSSTDLTPLFAYWTHLTTSPWLGSNIVPLTTLASLDVISAPPIMQQCPSSVPWDKSSDR